MSTEANSFVEFTADVGSWKAGHIEALKPSVARGLIEAGQAKESDSLAYMRASLDAASDKRFADLKEEIRALAPKGAPKGPPNGGGAVDFGRISEGTPAFEAKEHKRNFTDVLRCIHAVQAKGAPAEMRMWAEKRLQHVYSDEQIEYKYDDATGKFNSHVTRQLQGGGTETIIRTGTDSLGGGATYGYSIKPNYLGDLFRIARESEVFASACRDIPMPNGIETKYPALGQYSAPTVLNGIIQPAVFGGITLSYSSETAARVSSDAAMEEINFKAVDMTGATDFSRDYIVDNFIAMDSIVTGMFGDAMAWMEDWMTIQGPNTACPQGFFNASATIQGGGISGGATRETANKITSGDLGWMLSHLAPCPSPRWIAHRSTIPQLFILNNVSGTPVFQPNSSIVQSDPLSIMNKSNPGASITTVAGMLLGLPIFFTEKVPQLGATGDISLVCPSQYGLAERDNFEVGMSEHFYFSTDRIAYRFKKRHDARSLWRKPYTDASGGPASPTTGWTISPFIMLAHV